MGKEKMRMRLKGYDDGVIDEWGEKIVESGKGCGGDVCGGIGLGREKWVYRIIGGVDK